MRILGIETSCDETSAAVVDYSQGRFCVLSNVVSSQINIHKKYGGVVPEIAARKQVELIMPVIEETLLQAQRSLIANGRTSKKEYGTKNLESRNRNIAPQIPNSKFQILSQIDTLAVTIGPGLMIALSVGVETARTLAAILKKPIVGVNHLEGHLYSSLLPAKKSNFQFPISPAKADPPLADNSQTTKLRFPAIAIIVSGGHTELILVRDYLKYKKLGSTRDDAAGEAYDKVSKLLGLGYPGGPIIDRLANQGDATAFDFPRGMIKSGDYDFSFSGLKTAVLYKFQEISSPHCHPARGAGSRKQNNKKNHSTLNSKFKIPDSTLNNLCASFQAAVVDVLVAKTIRAAKQYHAKTILLGGGVAANSALREQLKIKTQSIIPNSSFLIPDLLYTTDNAAMIAAAAAFHAKNKQFTDWRMLKANPNLSF